MIAAEKQSLKGTFLMYAIILIELPTIALLAGLYFTGKMGENGRVHLVIVGGIMVLTFSLIMSLKLETRMDLHSFSYRNPPFINSWRKLKKEEINSIAIHKKDGLLEYGGLGIRFFSKTKAYIYMADHVIEVQQGDKKLVFTTKRPEDFNLMIREWAS